MRPAFHKRVVRLANGSLLKILALIACVGLSAFSALGFAQSADDSLFRADNLVAWCIVPFDASKRTPAQRTEMLVELGIKRCAYDWRDEHIPTFEEEFLQYQKHGIELFAFWGIHDEAFRLFEKYDLHPQIWLTLPDPSGETETKVARAAESLVPIAQRTGTLKLPLGLYNHGGWGGEPENMVAVCKRLHELGHEHVGIVYNFHHGHEHISSWRPSLDSMLPYLLCVNVNGMNSDAQPKILALGSGEHEASMMRSLIDSEYSGRIGIIDHQEHRDTKLVLQENLAGLQTVLRQVDENRVNQLLDDSLKRGDGNRGAAVLGSDQTACVSCHAIEHPASGVMGGQVGPDLACVLRERSPQQIVEALLWPQREVAPEFRLWQVETADGAVVSGYRVFEENQDDDLSPIVLRQTSTGDLVTIERDNIESLTQSGSPMPDGLLTRLTGQQKIDLIRCLIDLKEAGKFNDIQLDAIERSYRHGFATFAWHKDPVESARWPHHTAYVNRDRVYDFYAKQAEHFRKLYPAPLLLEPYPGLDGGVRGHWGNQDEQTWADSRWNDSILGSIQCGVLRHESLTVPRGVCLQLGEPGQLFCCFDPDRLDYPVVWRGDFVRFSNVRHGFMDGIWVRGQRLDDQPLQRNSLVGPNSQYRYLGLYRIGARVAFKYEIDGRVFLDAPWVEDGQLTIERAPIDEHSLRDAVQQGSGTAQWPEKIETAVRPGSAGPFATGPFAIDTIELPNDNPWKAMVFLTGHDFLPDGSALVCSMTGDVWLVRGFEHVEASAGTEQQPAKATWKRFAAGLNQPLGLWIDQDGIFVQCRDQLVRLVDHNNDGEADFYECFSNAFATSPAGHDYVCDLQRDSEGNFYTVSGNQGLVRISPDGRNAATIATGFRNPDGVGILPDGTLTVPCSEGDWTPASMICAVPNLPTRGANENAMVRNPPFYGYGGPRGGTPPELPLVYLPRGLDNSSGGQVVVPHRTWGRLAGQLLHFSFGAGSWFSVLVDEVDGQLQGGIALLTGDFLSGVHRGRFHPGDGQLYVTGMNGWGTYTKEDGCFQRIRHSGEPWQHPLRFHAHRNGVLIEFAEPLDVSVAENLASHFAQAWNYRYSAGYGSEEYSPSHPGVVGHDCLTITAAHVVHPNRLFLEMPDIQPVNQLHLRMHVHRRDNYPSVNPVGDGHDLFLTIHRLDTDFTDYPGYEPFEKKIALHPILVDLAMANNQVKNPWLEPVAEGERAIELKTGKNLSFETTEVRVRPGEAIALTLVNTDVVPHNWVLIQPERLSAVGGLVDRLIGKPESHARHYVPESPDVIVHTDIVLAGKSQTIHFLAPQQPGRYPYLCTFPGHWMVMNGVLVVEP